MKMKKPIYTKFEQQIYLIKFFNDMKSKKKKENSFNNDVKTLNGMSV